MTRRKFYDPNPTEEFFSEHDMRDHIAEHLGQIEPGLHLYGDGRGNIEFPCRMGGGRSGSIDILAVDADGRLVVLEVKYAPATTSAVGQVFGYMLWVLHNLEPRVLPVRGMILTTSLTPFLELAVHNFSHFPLSVTVLPDRNTLRRAL